LFFVISTEALRREIYYETQQAPPDSKNRDPSPPMSRIRMTKGKFTPEYHAP